MEKVNKTLELENKPPECLKFVFEFLILPLLFGLVQLTFNIDTYLVFVVFLPDPRTLVQFSSVQSLSHVWLFDPLDGSTSDFPVHHQFRSLLKLVSIRSVMSSNHLILCRPLLLLPSVFPSIRVFSRESVLRIRWPRTLVDMTIFWHCVKIPSKIKET